MPICSTKRHRTYDLFVPKIRRREKKIIRESIESIEKKIEKGTDAG
jgi:hypothetical protein